VNTTAVHRFEPKGRQRPAVGLEDPFQHIRLPAAGPAQAALNDLLIRRRLRGRQQAPRDGKECGS